MVLGAIARGVVGRAGRGSKMAGRMFKRKETPASQQIVDVQATPANVKPTTPLIPPSPAIDANTISKATPSIGTETLEGTAYRIKTSLVDVDTLLKGSIALDKIRETERRRGLEKKKDEDKEKKLESAAKKNGSKFGLGKLVPTKAKSIFGNIINFFVTLLLGKILMGLLDNVGLFKNLALGLAAVANFVLDWGGKLLNAFVSLIGLGYGIYDGLRGTVGNLFGESGMKMFDKFSGVFTLLLNTALIAAMTAGRSGMLGGGGPGPGGLTRVGGVRGVKPTAVPTKTSTPKPKFASKPNTAITITPTKTIVSIATQTPVLNVRKNQIEKANTDQTPIVIPDITPSPTITPIPADMATPEPLDKHIFAGPSFTLTLNEEFNFDSTNDAFIISEGSVLSIGDRNLTQILNTLIKKQ